MLGIFLDIETNGLNIKKHHPIELAFRILDLLTGEEREHYSATLQVSSTEWEKSDPNSLEVNGFSFADTVKGLTRAECGREVLEIFKRQEIKRGSSVFICQNPSFDRGFFTQIVDTDIQEELQWPYHWLDLASMWWGEQIKSCGVPPFQKGLSKDKIATALNIPPEAHPHKAMNGVDHLIACYRALVGFPRG